MLGTFGNGHRRLKIVILPDTLRDLSGSWDFPFKQEAEGLFSPRDGIFADQLSKVSSFNLSRPKSSPFHSFLIEP